MLHGESAYVCVQQHRSSGSKEKMEHWREVHRQQESDDCYSLSLILAEQSPEQYIHV